MAVEISTEKKVCGLCGADVRPNTTFCYNCGASLKENVIVETEKTISDGNSNFPQSEVVVKQNGKNSLAETDAKVSEQEIVKPFAESSKVKTKSAKIETAKAESKDNPPLKSAASMRRQPKSAQPKIVEVVWDQPENSTSIWFVIFAFILILFAVGALLLMLYLK